MHQQKYLRPTRGRQQPGDSIFSEFVETEFPRVETSTYRLSRLNDQSLKYSQVSEHTSQLSFIDFIYDLEEFQTILVGDQYMSIFLVDENDPQYYEFLISMEDLINRTSRFMTFYYTFSGKLCKQNPQLQQMKFLWVYRGAKKIVQVVLNSVQKMLQMEELFANIRQTSQQRNQGVQAPPVQKSRSKSIKRLLQQSQQSRQGSQYIQDFTSQQSNMTPNRQQQAGSFVTHIQARVLQRQPQFQEDDTYVTTEFNPPEIKQQPTPSKQIINEKQDQLRPKTVAVQQDSDYQVYLQDKLIELSTDLENKRVLDMQTARLVKRLILEENKQIIMVLTGYLQNIYDEQVLIEKITRIVNQNEDNYQRPSSPIRQQNIPEKKQITLEQLKQEIFEKNISQFNPEDYGMAFYLINQNDQVLLSLMRDTHQKVQENKFNLISIQAYVKGRFQDVLQKQFTFSEIQQIQEKKENRTSAIYAIFSCFRYENNLNTFIESLRQAIDSLQRMSISKQQDQPIINKQKKDSQSDIQVPKLVLKVTGDVNRNKQQQQSGYGSFCYLMEEQPQPKIQLVKQIETIQKAAKEEIFSEEEFLALKSASRKENSSKIEAFFTTQRETDVEKSFDDIMRLCQLDEQLKQQFRSLIQQNDQALYEIIKNYQTYRSITEVQNELLRFNFNKHEDYRKMKLYKIYHSKIKEFFNMKLLAEVEYNYLLKLFREEDIQVLGVFENYLYTNDCEDLLDSLRLIVKEYSKYINIHSIDYEQKQPQIEQQQFLLKSIPSKERVSSSSPKGSISNQNDIIYESKLVINKHRQYFSAEQKQRLESIAEQGSDVIYRLNKEFEIDSDLNGFIHKMIGLTQDSPTRTRNEENEIINDLIKTGLLKLDDFMISKIIQQKDQPILKGIFSYYRYNLDKKDLAESLKLVSKKLQKTFIFEQLDQIAQEQNWNTEKLVKLHQLTESSNAILLGAFSVYFGASESEQEIEKLELIDTLQRLL